MQLKGVGVHAYVHCVFVWWVTADLGDGVREVSESEGVTICASQANGRWIGTSVFFFFFFFFFNKDSNVYLFP